MYVDAIGCGIYVVVAVYWVHLDIHLVHVLLCCCVLSVESMHCVTQPLLSLPVVEGQCLHELISNGGYEILRVCSVPVS